MSDEKPPLPPPPKDLPRRGDAFRHWKTGTVYVVTGVSRSEHDPGEFNVNYLPEGVSEDEEIPWKRTWADFNAVVMQDGALMATRRFKSIGRREVKGFLRPEVAAFARAMEEKLRKNDHKGGWKDESARSLLERAEDEIKELDLAVTCLRDDECGHYKSEDEKRQSVRGEAADVANFVMMVADVCEALGP